MTLPTTAEDVLNGPRYCGFRPALVELSSWGPNIYYETILTPSVPLALRLDTLDQPEPPDPPETPVNNETLFTMVWERRAQDLIVNMNYSPLGNQYQFQAMVNFDRSAGTTLGYDPTTDGARNTIIFNYYSAPGDVVSGSLLPLTSAIYYIGPLAADLGYSATYLDYRIHDEDVQHLQLFFTFNPTTDMSNTTGANLQQYRASYVFARWLGGAIGPNFLTHANVTLATCDDELICIDEAVIHTQ